jgi:uncharacterized membrane protein (DUF485 family)
VLSPWDANSASLSECHTQSIASAESSAQKANNIAIAGVVIAVLLAVVALILAVVYVMRTKNLDQKYSK